MQKTCLQCSAPFEVTEDDLKFYKKISPVFLGKKYDLPEPKCCPECRQQQRLSFRNERTLYKRKCDATEKNMISIYPTDTPYTVYSHEAWWSDEWDSLAYGRDFDFSRPFFEQFSELWHSVPLIGLNVLANENCEFVSYCGYSKNCYLTYNCDFSEDILYSSDSIRCKNCMDIYKCIGSELCYDSIDLHNCYNIGFSEYSTSCSNSDFLYDCRNCQDCFCCAGLRNKKYHILNKAYSEKEYRDKLSEMKQLPTAELQKTIATFLQKHPRPATRIHNSHNVSGNYIYESKNVTHSFDIEKCEDVKYCGTINSSKDCYDWDYTGYTSELCYELSSCGDRLHNCSFCFNIWSGGQNLTYCVLGSGLKNCFGCVGLKHKQYCILNKQYTKEEYEKLVPQIIEHMQKSGEWGQFFPIELSPFSYNESIAYNYYPLKKPEALAKGWRWREIQDSSYSEVTRRIDAVKLPKKISDIPDDILNWAIICSESKRLFKIQKVELEFYRKMKFPIPRLHPDVRHAKRMELRNPRQLWQRKCDHCQKEIQTTYAPERSETVYCEECYLKTVY